MNNNLHGEEFLIKQIEKNKNEITKDTALLAASAIAVGVGVLGVAVFGKEMLDFFDSNNLLTFSNFMTVKFQGMGVGVSMSATLAGITGAISKYKHLVSTKKELNANKQTIKEIRESDFDLERDFESYESEINGRTR